MNVRNLDMPHHTLSLNTALVYRNWLDDTDYDSLSRVLIASRNADGVTEARMGDDLRGDFDHKKNFVAARDLFLVESDNQLLGFASCKWWQEASGKFIHRQELEVLPAWRGRGIEAELLRNLEAHQRIEFAEHAAKGLGWFEIEIEDTRGWLALLLQTSGYQPVRYFDSMLRDNLENIPDAALPAGIETRPVTPAQLRQIFWGGEQAFSGHWSSPIADERDFELWLGQDLNTPLWQIAWDGDEFVGMVRNDVSESENKKYGYLRGYTEEIAMREPWRGRGVGKALLVRSLKMFRDMGFGSTILAVGPVNVTCAQHLYLSVGYKTIHRSTVYRLQM